MDMKPDYSIVNTYDELEALVKRCGNQRRIGVDLEADSMFHFKEKVCLIQIGDADAGFVIDPLHLTDISALQPIFSDPSIQKIFHGADYDIRSLYRDFSFDINNLFDTHLACRFLGYSETSLDALLQKHFQIKLDKKYQKKDWSQRPLSDEMIKYAAFDVIYLVKLAIILEEELIKKGRLGWVEEECSLLSKVRYPHAEAEPLYMRFKGAGRLNPRSLAILESLLAYRKEIAEKKDRPVFKVISNDALLRIARAKPLTLHQLEDLQALSFAQISMYGTKIIQLIQQDMETPENHLMSYPRQQERTLSGRAADRVKALKEWRDEKAGLLEMDPALVCSKSQIVTIATDNPRQLKDIEKLQELRNWQKEQFGKEIIRVLRSV